MLRKNLMNILLGAAGVGAVLTGYNALVRNNDGADSATSKLTSYLNIDQVKQEAETNNGTEVVISEPSSNDTSTDTTAETPSTTDASTNAPDSTSTSTPAATGEAKAETTYVVKEGDTYGCIAEKYYGSYEHYVDVMAANPTNWDGFSERELHVGATLTLPAVAKENLKPISALCS